MKKLDHTFFNRNTVDVAIDLLGKKFLFNSQVAIITETEAYRGYDDAASHAYRGPTERSQIMFGEAGYSYVYLIYGIYYCLNIVTEEKGIAGAVLIRGIKLDGVMYNKTNGPGKLCRHLGINKDHHALNITTHNKIYLTEGVKVKNYFATERIGISAGTDKLWRFTSIIT